MRSVIVFEIQRLSCAVMKPALWTFIQRKTSWVPTEHIPRIGDSWAGGPQNRALQARTLRAATAATGDYWTLKIRHAAARRGGPVVKPPYQLSGLLLAWSALVSYSPVLPPALPISQFLLPMEDSEPLQKQLLRMRFRETSKLVRNTVWRTALGGGNHWNPHLLVCFEW